MGEHIGCAGRGAGGGVGKWQGPPQGGSLTPCRLGPGQPNRPLSFVELPAEIIVKVTIQKRGRYVIKTHIKNYLSSDSGVYEFQRELKCEACLPTSQ